MMPVYETEMTVLVTIEATNAAAAKDAIKHKRFGGVRVIGESYSSRQPPSVWDKDISWHSCVTLSKPQFGKFKRIK